jgi:uncharacterized protein
MLKFWLKFGLYLVVGTCLSVANADNSVSFFRALAIDNDRSVRAYLAEGFDPNTANFQGQPALVLAVKEESWKVVAALLADRRTRVDEPNAHGETALMMAALRGNLEWAQRLVERGAALSRSGWAPLHYAATGPSVPVLQWLVKQGAAIDAPSPNGSTPLMMAARYGPEEAADWLLAQGADPRLRNERDMNAADFARSVGRTKLAERLQAAAVR